MQFTVIPRFGRIAGKSQAYLTWDDWNDYSYYTLYGLIYADKNGMQHDIGGVKIAFVEQEEEQRSLQIGDSFTALEDDFFSLGNSSGYYENLNSIDDDVRDDILSALRDIAKFPAIYDMAIQESVTQTSLLRGISPLTVTGQFRRMASGGATLTEYNFKFISPTTNSNGGYHLSFEVQPESFPPTNIHVLIGKNGVGKTYLLNQMIGSLVSPDDPSIKYGDFVAEGDGASEDENLFVNLVSVTFSAFDETEPQREQKDATKGILYCYIGLKSTENLNPKSTDMLMEEFLTSLNACKIRSKYDSWIDAITTLEADSNFKDSGVKKLITLPEKLEEYRLLGSEIFKKLSSGHKIVLLTITRLIETVQEKTLVLIDEPEAHLHPPLLAAFIRAISDLLIKTNGVAIIATHSPVILQEVPRSCVWKLRKVGTETAADRLAVESFGENVGTLTGEVFELEATHSGFYKLLEEQVAENKTYRQIISHFGGQVGMEARAILMALIANRDNN